MPLSQSTIAQILETASPHIRRDPAGPSFTLVCTVEEGIACRFASSNWADQSLAPLAFQIIDDLGWKTVEHASRRQILVRCTQDHCEWDRGDGFEPF